MLVHIASAIVLLYEVKGREGLEWKTGMDGNRRLMKGVWAT